MPHLSEKQNTDQNDRIAVFTIESIWAANSVNANNAKGIDSAEINK